MTDRAKADSAAAAPPSAGTATPGAGHTPAPDAAAWGAPVLRLKKREERRALAGHRWVFSNEIDTALTPLKGLEPGADVVLEAANGRFVAHAHANPASLIAARVTSRARNRRFDAAELAARVSDAHALRARRYPEPWYRLVHGEGDALPGLVVDRYDHVAVVQITTAGMERMKADVVAALLALDGVTAVLFRNDAPSRAMEGLESYREQAAGDPVESLAVRENGLDYRVPADVSQKTGWFYDHRENRAALGPWVKGLRVLDLYTYLGGFALNAAAHGAREVVAVDSSAPALEAAKANAEANGFGDIVRFVRDDVVDAMRRLLDEGELFDVVVLDPPAFIKRKKDRDAGLRHYELNNRLALRLLAPGGLLLSASCSQALDMAGLVDIVRRAAPKGHPGLQLLQPLAQAPDHPVAPAMPETAYLCGGLFRQV